MKAGNERKPAQARYSKLVAFWRAEDADFLEMKVSVSYNLETETEEGSTCRRAAPVVFLTSTEIETIDSML